MIGFYSKAIEKLLNEAMNIGGCVPVGASSKLTAAGSSGYLTKKLDDSVFVEGTVTTVEDDFYNSIDSNDYHLTCIAFECGRSTQIDHAFASKEHRLYVYYSLNDDNPDPYYLGVWQTNTDKAVNGGKDIFIKGGQAELSFEHLTTLVCMCLKESDKVDSRLFAYAYKTGNYDPKLFNEAGITISIPPPSVTLINGKKHSAQKVLDFVNSPSRHWTHPNNKPSTRPAYLRPIVRSKGGNLGKVIAQKRVQYPSGFDDDPKYEKGDILGGVVVTTDQGWEIMYLNDIIGKCVNEIVDLLVLGPVKLINHLLGAHSGPVEISVGLLVDAIYNMEVSELGKR